jgi:hypothetical protein
MVNEVSDEVVGLFEGEEAVLHVIERIVAPLGLRGARSSPWVDARLLEDRACKPDLFAPYFWMPPGI